ncbi:hypothetical protein SME22J_35750 [Serratia marcescens]|nr:hypothetical protein SME22J_35750 [Serratia marcescens]BEO44163.1 hypothetical protein SMQE13_35140 [Serratia marcescens]
MEYGLSDNGEQPDQHGKGVSRRNVLLGLASTLVATALAGAPFLTLAEQHTAAQNPLLFARFFALSRQLTERQDIDPGISARIFTALRLANPQFSSQVERLSARVKAGQSARQLQQIAGQLGLLALVSAIVTAWYTGTVGQGMYRLALNEDGSLLPLNRIKMDSPSWIVLSKNRQFAYTTMANSPT